MACLVASDDGEAAASRDWTHIPKRVRIASTEIADSRHLSKVLDRIEDLVSSINTDDHLENPALLAQALLAFSRWLWALYFPVQPVDPAAVTSAEHQTLIIKADTLIAQTVALASLPSADPDSGASELSVRAANIDNLQHRLSAVSETTFVRLDADDAAFRSLHAELRRFESQVLRWDDLCTLIDNEVDSSTEAKLLNTASSIEALIRRLQKLYQPFVDFLQPLMPALVLARLAMTYSAFYAARLAQSSGLELAEQQLAALVAFPSHSAKTRVSQSGSIFPATSGIEHMLLRLHAVVDSRSRTPEMDLAVQETLQSIFEAWQSQETARLLADDAAGSMYRWRQHETHIESDDEVEALEIDQLFGDNPSTGASSRSSDTAFTASFAQVICAAHARWADVQSLQTVAAADFCHLRDEAVADIVTKHENLLRDKCDVISMPYILQMRSMQPDTPSRAYNVYKDAAGTHIDAILPTLIALQGRIRQILTEWPEQVLLSDLDTRIDALLSTPSNKPLSSIMAFVEGILVKIEEWQTFASSQTGLGEFREKVVQAIVTWRKLELQSWSALLQQEDESAIGKAAQLWFQLYRLLVFVFSLDTSAASDAIDLLHTPKPAEIIEAIEAYLRESPAVQYAERLNMLESFVVLLKSIAQSDRRTSDNQQRLHAIVANIHKYYGTKKSQIDEHIVTHRREATKAIGDIIKLSTWRDTNVLALRASSLRNHRSLYKVVRKYRQACDVAVNEIMDRAVTSAASTTIGEHIQRSEVDQVTQSEAAIDGKIIDTNASVAPLGLISPVLLANRINSRMLGPNSAFLELQHATLQMDDLATTVKKRCSELSRANYPSVSGKGHPSIPKGALLNLKKRAWSDFIRELRRVGLSNRPTERVLQGQVDAAQLFATAPLADAPAVGPTIQRAEKHFFAILAQLPAVRALLQSHAPEIPQHQLQSVYGSMTSCLQQCLNLRKSLGGILAMSVDFATLYHSVQLCATGRYKVAPTQVSGTDEFIQLARELLHAVPEAVQELIQATQTAGGAVDIGKSQHDFDNLLDIARSVLDKWQYVATQMQSSFGASRYILLQADNAEDPATTLKNFLMDTDSILSRHADVAPSTAFLCDPLVRWTRHNLGRLGSLGGSQQAASINDARLRDCASTAVNAIIVALQQVLLLEAETEQSEELVPGQVNKAFDSSRALLSRLRTGSVVSNLRDLLRMCSRYVAQGGQGQYVERLLAQ